VGPHEEFLELCALATSGELTEEEQKKLDAHLAECAECRKAFQQFEAVAHRAIPSLAPELAPELTEETRETTSSPDPGEAAFFKRLRRKERRRGDEAPDDPTAPQGPDKKHNPFRSRLRRSEVWLPFAAGILLILTLGIVIFRGRTQSVEVARAGKGSAPTEKTSPEERRPVNPVVPVSGAANSGDHDKIVVGLRHDLEVQFAETTRLKAQLKALENRAQSSEAEKTGLALERDALAQKLQTEEASLARTQKELEVREEHDTNESARVAGLEAKVADLSHLLDERARTVDRQTVLLERDRDVRELMGARDLYIAEVYDVGRTGETQKPCGRVFLTKGKSLIFYAFDLDQQPGLKAGSSFQAWGQHGPDRSQAFNLGIFYEDNAAKKRWVVKSDDPKTLAQIDAVFVTVEPKGGSSKPSSKPLLFAYLKVEANHP
jgi:hypothetical protein